MTATVPSYQHGKPWPIDNVAPPRGLEDKGHPPINTKLRAADPLDPLPTNPRTAEEFMLRIKHAVRELSGVFR